MLFGDAQYEQLPEIPDELLRIVIDSGVARNQWDTITRQMQLAAARRDRLGFSTLFRRYGLPTALLSTAWRSSYLGTFRERSGTVPRHKRYVILEFSMGKIIWGVNGPYEVGEWGGAQRIPLDDPRVANDPRAKRFAVTPDGDTIMEDARKRERSDTIDTIPESDTKKTTTGMETSGNLPGKPGERGTLALSASSGEGSNGTGETPVMMNVRPQLGLFTETFTAILPIRFGLGFHELDGNGPDFNTIKIRMNAPYNVLRDTVLVSQTEGATMSNGVSACQAPPYSSANPASLLTFETTLLASTQPTASTSGAGSVPDAGACPAWRKWFEKIYESYHTIETQYRISFVNPETEIGRRARVYVDKDVYTTSSAGNVMPTDRGHFYMNSLWKRIDSHIIAERNNSTNEPYIKVIEGTWRPGQWSKNTLNAEDIKAWYPTGAEPSPGWVENLVICAMTDEFNTSFCNLNVFVELRYIVQFKDLKATFRYSQASGTAVTFSTPSSQSGSDLATQVVAAGDILQVPHARYFWGSGA